MNFAPFLGFAAVSLTLALTPGADWAYTIAAGIRGGSPAPSVAGLCTGYLGLTAIVATGLGVLLAARPSLVAWLSIAGALYLLWLGMTTARGWRGAGYHADGAALPGRSGAFGDFLRGAGTSGINPKALLLYMAVMPQFVQTGSPLPVPVQTAMLGLIHVVITVVVYALVAVAARRLLRAAPRRAQLVTLASGVIMLGIGIALLVEQVPVLTRGV
ncbi:LysE family translocator [Sinomonas terrae]|uniref:LysE family translocator n=1 Tax=Sinomonas terrae TaxID=2908838 RepID=A0ABS9TYS0_9MICC|nr:LysE family translocator [Sinomonas terrae]MCH6469574.1 LysE family translocator [Sinomonas terrae]